MMKLCEVTDFHTLNFNTGLTSSWKDPDEVDAIAGDKIDFDRGLFYNHVGISDGKGGVYHYSGNGQGSSGLVRAKKECSISS